MFPVTGLQELDRAFIGHGLVVDNVGSVDVDDAGAIHSGERPMSPREATITTSIARVAARGRRTSIPHRLGSVHVVTILVCWATWACRADDPPVPVRSVEPTSEAHVEARPSMSAQPVAPTADARDALPHDERVLTIEDLRGLAEAGDPDAQLALAARYYDGNGVPKDDTLAAAWLRRAADRGHAWAQANLAMLYSRGHGVPRDEAEAATWLRRAAEQGLVTAQANLARMYLQGQGVEKDAVEGARWLRRAADQDFPAAQSNLGLLYLRGEGVATDPAEAAKWLRLAADAGVGDAQARLGVLYERGRGVECDRVAA